MSFEDFYRLTPKKLDLIFKALSAKKEEHFAHLYNAVRTHLLYTVNLQLKKGSQVKDPSAFIHIPLFDGEKVEKPLPTEDDFELFDKMISQPSEVIGTYDL